MVEERYENENRVLDEEEIIDEFLGEEPRARELRLMRTVLEQRRAGVLRDRERAKDDKERAVLTTRIAELDKQIAVLRKEEEITNFVETSVRVTLMRPSADEFEE